MAKSVRNTKPNHLPACPVVGPRGAPPTCSSEECSKKLHVQLDVRARRMALCTQGPNWAPQHADMTRRGHGKKMARGHGVHLLSSIFNHQTFFPRLLSTAPVQPVRRGPPTPCAGAEGLVAPHTRPSIARNRSHKVPGASGSGARDCQPFVFPLLLLLAVAASGPAPCLARHGGYWAGWTSLLGCPLPAPPPLPSWTQLCCPLGTASGGQRGWRSWALGGK